MCCWFEDMIWFLGYFLVKAVSPKNTVSVSRMNHSLSNRGMEKLPCIMFKLKRWHALSFCLIACWGWAMRRRRADVQRSSSRSVWRFREVLLHIHRNTASVKLIAPLKLLYLVRNLHVGSVVEDGQSVCKTTGSPLNSLKIHSLCIWFTFPFFFLISFVRSAVSHREP